MRVMVEWLNRSVGLAVVGFVFVMLGAPRVSLAQYVWVGEIHTGEFYEEMSVKEYLPRIRVIAILCGWTDVQYEAGRTLMESYIHRRERAKLKKSEYMTFLRNQRGGDPFPGDEERELRHVLDRELKDYEARIFDELKSDLKDVLTAEQLPEWEWVEKLWRVHEQPWILYKYGARGQTLLQTVSDKLLETDVSPEMRAVLKNYLAELDQTLRQMEANRRKHFVDRDRIYRNMKLSAKEKVEAVRQLGHPNTDAKMKAREVSDASLQQLLALMPELEGAELELGLYVNNTYGQDMTISDHAKLCNRVMQMKSVTDDQRAQIRGLRLQYLRARLAEVKAELREEGDENRQEFDEQKRWEEIQKQHKQSSEQLARLRVILSAAQIEEAGPPISVKLLYVPEFEGDDEPPPVNIDPRREVMVSGRASQVNAIDVVFLVRLMGLGEAQNEAARNLVAGYESRFRLTMRKMKAFDYLLKEGMAGMTDVRLFQEEMRVRTGGSDYLERIKGELFHDLRQLLTEEQVQKWEVFERRIARKSVGVGNWTIGRMMSVDLPGMLEGVLVGGGVPNGGVMDVIESYEREMHPLVKEIAELRDKEMEDDGDGHPEKLDELAKRIDEVTGRYFLRMSGVLEGEQKMMFEDAVFMAILLPPGTSFSGSSRTLDAMELPREIGRLKDLTEAQRERVDEIVQEQRLKIHEVKRSLYEALVAIGGINAEFMKRHRAISNDPMKGQFTRMHDLHDSMVKELLAVLTPEQVGKLPQKWRKPEPVPYPQFDED